LGDLGVDRVAIWVYNPLWITVPHGGSMVDSMVGGPRWIQDGPRCSMVDPMVGRMAQGVFTVVGGVLLC